MHTYIHTYTQPYIYMVGGGPMGLPPLNRFIQDHWFHWFFQTNKPLY